MRSLRQTLPALIVLAGVTIVDAASGNAMELVPLLALGPMLAAALAGLGETVAIAVLAVLIALPLSVVDGHFGSRFDVVSWLVVAGVGAVSILVAHARGLERRRRQGAERGRTRADFEAAASALFEQGADPLQRLADLTALAVPAMADLCIVDLARPDGTIDIAALAAREPAQAIALRAARHAHPIEAGSSHPVAGALHGDPPFLRNNAADADLARWASSPEHLALMRELAYQSMVVVPVTARGRAIGALSLLRTVGSRPFERADLETVSDVARRTGLALDHARLFGELATTERERETILSALAEAVTVQRPDGNLVYANQAAAELLGFPSVKALLDAPMRDFWAVHDARDETGEPLSIEALPGRRALAGEEHPEPLVLHAIDAVTETRRWWRIKASPVLDAAGRPLLAVNVIEDITDQRRRQFDQAFLAEASQLLNASLDVSATLEQVARAAVPELADWCAVDMPDDDGRLRRVATADRSAQRRHSTVLVVGVDADGAGNPGRVGPPEVMRTGRSQLYREIDDDLLRAAARDERQLAELRAVGARSALVVPMMAGDQVIGAISMGTVESPRRLDEADLALAEELGRRAGIAVEHSRVHAERSSVAATLQEALLPPRLPVIPGLAVAARFRAATWAASRVGGDFYDLFEVDGEGSDWMVVMGDVTGKGPAAAAITSLARYTMRTAALYERSPSHILERLNHVLSHDDDRRRLCTAVCLRVAIGSDGVAVTVASAGHPPPLLATADGRVEGVGDPGTLLGAFPQGEWSDTTVQLGRGETLVLYTDGVTDTRGSDGRFGPERLQHLLAALGGQDADAVAAGLDEALLGFQAGEQDDDVALLVLQPTGGGSEQRSETALLGVANESG